MKVCQVGSGIVQIPPEKGGAVERVIANISEFLSEEHEVEILDYSEGMRIDSKLPFTELENKYYKFRSGNPSIVRIKPLFIHPIIQKYDFGRKCKEYIEKNDFDVVHIHTVFSGFPIAFSEPSEKMVYTCHNPSWVVEDLDILNSGVNLLETFIMEKADKVTTVSDCMKRNLNQKAGVPSEKIDRIYNGVELNEKRSEEKNKKPVVLFLGKHTRHKGIQIFLKACEIINEEIPIRAISVGPFGRFGEDGGKFWEENELVEFWGGVSEERKQEALELADVALYPTDRESMGIVFIESQANGVPVVATDLPVCHESIVHGKTGLLVERDAESFAEAAIKIIRENWKQTHRGEIMDWIKKFSKENIGEKWMKFYSELDK